MGESEIRFGDKIFLYGQYLQFLDSFDAYEYNSVMGYMTVGGYFVTPIETDIFGASITGFVVEFMLDASLTLRTPFLLADMVDVTDKLAKDAPVPSGTRVFLPIPRL